MGWIENLINRIRETKDDFFLEIDGEKYFVCQLESDGFRYVSIVDTVNDCVEGISTSPAAVVAGDEVYITCHGAENEDIPEGIKTIKMLEAEISQKIREDTEAMEVYRSVPYAFLDEADLSYCRSRARWCVVNGQEVKKPDVHPTECQLLYVATGRITLKELMQELVNNKYFIHERTKYKKIMELVQCNSLFTEKEKKIQEAIKDLDDFCELTVEFSDGASRVVSINSIKYAIANDKPLDYTTKGHEAENVVGITYVNPLYMDKKQAPPKNSLAEILEKITPREMMDFYESRIYGQGDELKMAVYSIYRFLQNAASKNPKPADSWLLTAPSGSGKTEFFRATRDFFRERGIPIPVVQADLSQVTATGYRGMDAWDIPASVLQSHPDCGGQCIIFLDEADKLCRPSWSSHGENTNATAQATLLTMVEGLEKDVEYVKGKTAKFDSSKTMFVLLGAFQDLRSERAQDAERLSLGFLSGTRGTEGGDVWTPVTMDDIIRYGMMEELAGRLTFAVNFHPLSEDDLRHILSRKAEAIAQDMGVALHLTDSALSGLVKDASGPLGMRKPLSTVKRRIQEEVSRGFFDGSFDTDRDAVVIE